MRDLRDREDIVKVVDTFYSVAMTNEKIGYIFTDVAKLNLEKHIPTICDFWESILLGKSVYRGSVVSKHIDLHKMTNLEPSHFETWLGIWEKTVFSLYRGEKANEMIRRAKLMAEMMIHKINYFNHNPNMIL